MPKLVEWASVSIEKSIGQPTLPHLIVALNATDLSIDAQQWDSEEATRTLLSGIGKNLDKIPELKPHLDFWRKKHRVITSISDLLGCYFSSVTILRIPIKGRYMLMDTQVSKLYEKITEKAHESQDVKKRVRMLASSDDLQLYLRFAFSHFARYEKEPLDFIELALKIHPISVDFGGNVLKVAIAIKESNRQFTIGDIFQRLSILVSSCIMLDIHRHRRLGKLEPSLCIMCLGGH